MARRPRKPTVRVDIGVEQLGGKGDGSDDTTEQLSVAGSGGSGTPGDGTGSGDGNAASTVNPAQLGDGDGNSNGDGNAGSDTRERKRRSDAGRSRGARASQTAVDLGDFAEMVYATHGFIAGFTSPHMAITQEEAEQLTRAGANVLSHYRVPKMAAETAAWVRFAHICGMIYGTRFVAIQLERRMARAQNVTPPRAEPTRPSETRSTQPPGAPPQAQPAAPPPGTGRVNVTGLGSVSVEEAHKIN